MSPRPQCLKSHHSLRRTYSCAVLTHLATVKDSSEVPCQKMVLDTLQIGNMQAVQTIHIVCFAGGLISVGTADNCF